MRSLWLLFAAAVHVFAQPVSYHRIVNAASEPQNWLTYWGDYAATRYRNLDQINASNVQTLRVEWIFQTGQQGSFEAVPIVVDGILYFTAQDGNAYAVDGKTGHELWHYHYPMAPDVQLCCGSANRGFAILGSRLFMVTPDAHLLALDMRDGKVLWNAEMADYKSGYGATLAPLAIDGKILAGVSGGEFGIRGFVDAYDAETGKRVWRFYTVPAKGEPGGETWSGDSWKHGGGPTWMTGTYDPVLKTVYWGVGNPGPDLFGKDRAGDNLFTCSLIALDTDTGKLKWHFQFTPHDTHDWDANETPMLLDLDWQGRPRKLVVQANRNGFFYVLDRVSGEFLSAKAFARQTWAKGFDAKGRPIPNGDIEPTPEGNHQCPGLAGATNWMAPSYSFQTGLFYLQVREQCDVYYSSPPEHVSGKPFWGSLSRGVTEEKEWGELRALNPLTTATAWSFRHYRAPWAGTLSTSGGVVFAGDEDGYLMALDARSGKLLWRFSTGARLVTAPIAYSIEKRQYVAMPSGGALLVFALPNGGPQP